MTVNDGLELQMPCIVAQQAIADGVKGAGPHQPLQHRLRLVAEGIAQGLTHDVVCAPAHLGGGAAREGQQQHAAPGRPRACTSCATRCAMVVVLPVPAPAITSNGPARQPLSGGRRHR